MRTERRLDRVRVVVEIPRPTYGLRGNIDLDWVARCQVIACSIIRDFHEPVVVRVEEIWAERFSSLPEPPLDIRAQAIAAAREQAASATDPEQKAQVLESLRTAERAAQS